MTSINTMTTDAAVRRDPPHKPTRVQRRNPVRSGGAETTYAGQLKKIAANVGAIINRYPPGDGASVSPITSLLYAYANQLHDWATKTASSMLMDVALADARAWAIMSADIGRALKREIQSAPTGELMRVLLADQVALIKSIPVEAAQRVARLTMEGVSDGSRAKQVAADILNSTDVAKHRAVTIARTETSRVASKLTEARAVHVGSPGYVWTTSHDSTVRSDHRHLDGKFFTWDSPPVADVRAGIKAHPGCIWNCRCWAKVVIP